MSSTNSQGSEPNRGALQQPGWSTRSDDRAERRSDAQAAAGGGRLAALRIGGFFVATWASAAVLYFGRHSVAFIALSGVVALGGFDLFRPD
ncbi:hypothetical protein [Trinickia soli]|uniref:hypothetical protein n=1 Tax=Trinickia soli TaxID=380675 RepID=UPI0011AF1032|nr:hypothetical protein [Trinickia soli]CAB3638370.1 hypothetical protein LMG24076_00064 [Trinickia soli]